MLILNLIDQLEFISKPYVIISLVHQSQPFSSHSLLMPLKLSTCTSSFPQLLTNTDLGKTPVKNHWNLNLWDMERTSLTLI